MKKMSLFVLLLCSLNAFSKDYTDWDYYSVDEFYEKMELKKGTLDETGKKISFILVPVDIRSGTYPVTVTELKNDTYEVKGTGINCYVKFRSITGFCGYTGWKGVLEVGTNTFFSKFYKEP